MNPRTSQTGSLSPGERAACTVVERVLGVRTEAWDIDGRQGAVDARIHYPDGRLGVLEHSVLAQQPDMELDARLMAQRDGWPLPGRWWWSVQIAQPDYLARTRAVFERVVLLCESHNVTQPVRLPLSIQHDDPDVRWLLVESASSLMGHPTVPAREGTRTRTAMITGASMGGAVDDELVGLNAALDDALTLTHLAERVRKLRRHEADERHLFIPIHERALPYVIFGGLAFGERVPEEPPPIPPGISHLWLAPNFSQRVLVGTTLGWEQHHPYD